MRYRVTFRRVVIEETEVDVDAADDDAAIDRAWESLDRGSTWKRIEPPGDNLSTALVQLDASDATSPR
jgi:hypothetical protein